MKKSVIIIILIIAIVSVYIFVQSKKDKDKTLGEKIQSGDKILVKETITPGEGSDEPIIGSSLSSQSIARPNPNSMLVDSGNGDDSTSMVTVTDQGEIVETPVESPIIEMGKTQTTTAPTKKGIFKGIRQKKAAAKTNAEIQIKKTKDDAAKIAFNRIEQAKKEQSERELLAANEAKLKALYAAAAAANPVGAAQAAAAGRGGAIKTA